MFTSDRFVYALLSVIFYGLHIHFKIYFQGRSVQRLANMKKETRDITGGIVLLSWFCMKENKDILSISYMYTFCIQTD